MSMILQVRQWRIEFEFPNWLIFGMWFPLPLFDCSQSSQISLISFLDKDINPLTTLKQNARLCFRESNIFYFKICWDLCEEVGFFIFVVLFWRFLSEKKKIVICVLFDIPNKCTDINCKCFRYFESSIEKIS
jgi:hypothetical protein